MNSSTGGTTKDNNKLGIVKGAATVISGATITAHNCYGVGTQACADDDLLENRQPMNWEPVYRPKSNNQGANDE